MSVLRTEHKEKLITDKTYLAVTIPFMLSTVTQPLLGAVDTGIIGQMGDPGQIAGVSLGATLFNTVYWIFGFLRVSTTGYSARVRGVKDKEKQALSLFLPILLALSITMVLLIFQRPILSLYLFWIKPEQIVAGYVSQYYKILIWGAPCVLLNYVMLGWLMGQMRMKESLVMQIVGNVLNMVLDYWFVIGLGYGVRGIALATLIAQLITFLMGLFFIRKCRYIIKIIRKEWLSRQKIAGLVGNNRDLMLRTICLLIHNNIFAATGARMGTALLAANSILLQIILVLSYLFDGIANGSSVFSGIAVGQKSQSMIYQVINMTKKWTLIGAFLSVLAVGSLSSLIFSLFTPSQMLLDLCGTYSWVLLIYPIVASIGLTYYGIFTGSGVTKPIFYSTAIALVIFLVFWLTAVPIYGNAGLWFSFLIFYFCRSIFLLWWKKQVQSVI